jgi:protein kinase A
VDYWCFGVLIYEMLCGKTPFTGKDPMETYNNIIGATVEYPKDLPKNAKDLISKLLNRKKGLRLGNLENGILDIKEHPFFEGIDWDVVANRKMDSPLKVKLENSGSSKYYIPSKGRKSEDNLTLLSSSQNDLFKDF